MSEAITLPMSSADEHVRSDPGIPVSCLAEGQQAQGQKGKAEALVERVVLALLSAGGPVGHRLYLRGRIQRLRLRVYRPQLFPGKSGLGTPTTLQRIPRWPWSQAATRRIQNMQIITDMNLDFGLPCNTYNIRQLSG